MAEDDPKNLSFQVGFQTQTINQPMSQQSVAVEKKLQLQHNFNTINASLQNIQISPPGSSHEMTKIEEEDATEMKELLNQLTNTPSSPLVHITNKKRKQLMQSPSRQLLQF